MSLVFFVARMTFLHLAPFAKLLHRLMSHVMRAFEVITEVVAPCTGEDRLALGAHEDRAISDDVDRPLMSS